MKGDVLHYDDNLGTGQISGADGIRYSFTRADLKQLVPIGRGTKVDFDFDGKDAKDIYIDSGSGAAVVHAAPVAAAPAAMAVGAEQRLGMWSYYVRAYTKRFAKFSGRARRKEYWSVVLFSLIFMALFAAVIYAGTQSYGIDTRNEMRLIISLTRSPLGTVGVALVGLYSLASILPVFGLLVRRAHDIGWPSFVAWLIIIAYFGGMYGYFSRGLNFDIGAVISGVGTIGILLLALIPGDPNPNKYGPPTK